MSPANLESQSNPGTSNSIDSESLISRLFAGLDAVDFIIAASFCAYAAIFIFKSSFKIGDVRYFSLFDDDMISMRYAANLAHGYGLRWNPGGEKILGFTNPLWVLYMAFFHLLPIAAAKVSLCIQVSGALFLLLNLFVVRAICTELMPGARSVAIVAMTLTAFYGPLDNWALQGTEVSILTLVVSVSVWLALMAAKSETRPMPIYLLLGISTLIRLDMVVFSGVLLLAMAAMQRRQWRRHLLLGGVTLGAFLIVQAGFNLFYYGDLLPNTYYLKMMGFPLLLRIQRGVRVGILFLLPWIPIVLALGLSGLRRHLRRAWLLAAAIAAQCAYSIWVGGDAWEWYGGSNRYISIAIPLVFVLGAIGIEGVAERLVNRNVSSAGVWIRNLTLGASAAIFLFLVNCSHLQTNFLLKRPVQTDGNEDMVRQALLLRELTDDHATVAVVWAGAAPYFSGREAIDLLGKSDSKIAHEQMHVDPVLMARSFGFWPGHLKWDYDYSIGQLKPDVVLQLWAVSPDSITDLSRDYAPVKVAGFTWYVRRTSDHILWTKLQDPNPSWAMEFRRIVSSDQASSGARGSARSGTSGAGMASPGSGTTSRRTRSSGPALTS